MADGSHITHHLKHVHKLEICVRLHGTIIPRCSEPLSSELGTQSALGQTSTGSSDHLGTPGVVLFCIFLVLSVQLASNNVPMETEKFFAHFLNPLKCRRKFGRSGICLPATSQSSWLPSTTTSGPSDNPATSLFPLSHPTTRPIIHRPPATGSTIVICSCQVLLSTARPNTPPISGPNPTSSSGPLSDPLQSKPHPAAPVA